MLFVLFVSYVLRYLCFCVVLILYLAMWLLIQHVNYIELNLVISYHLYAGYVQRVPETNHILSEYSVAATVSTYIQGVSRL